MPIRSGTFVGALEEVMRITLPIFVVC
jgi:hypothetical protein